TYQNHVNQAPNIEY
ncbi:SE2200 family small protein, partial [Staphylococcus epidermidis]